MSDLELLNEFKNTLEDSDLKILIQAYIDGKKTSEDLLIKALELVEQDDENQET